jgi:hypothetical protein
MTWTQKETQIFEALNSVMDTCGLDDTKKLFDILDHAMASVAKRWNDEVELRRAGINTDMRKLLALEIVKVADGANADRYLEAAQSSASPWSIK